MVALLVPFMRVATAQLEDRVSETLRLILRLHAALGSASATKEIARPLHMRANILISKLKTSEANARQLLGFIPWELGNTCRFQPFMKLIEDLHMNLKLRYTRRNALVRGQLHQDFVTCTKEPLHRAVTASAVMLKIAVQVKLAAESATQQHARG